MSAAQEIVTREDAPPPAEIVSHAAGLLSIIERAARDPSVDLDKFERLMAMQERIQQAEAKRQFNAAIAAAKGEFEKISKNRKVDFTSQKGRTNYRHEDLAEIARAVDPALAKHGLNYRFRVTQEGQRVSVACILAHRDGYSEETLLTAAEDHSGNKNSIQAIGSAASYLQRYTLKAALGLAVSHDDDGAAAGEASQADELASDEQIENVRKALEFAGSKGGGLDETDGRAQASCG